MYTHILAPTDGSELSTKGLNHALALAKALAAKVTIITITELAVYDAGAVLIDYRDQQEAAAKAALAAALQAAEAAGVTAEALHISQALPAQAIIEAAKTRNCDLIVMASHGRRGVSRMILGSQTAEVLAHSTGPVLIVR